jgi:hypothetical protein
MHNVDGGKAWYALRRGQGPRNQFIFPFPVSTRLKRTLPISTWLSSYFGNAQRCNKNLTSNFTVLISQNNKKNIDHVPCCCLPILRHLKMTASGSLLRIRPVVMLRITSKAATVSATVIFLNWPMLIVPLVICCFSLQTYSSRYVPVSPRALLYIPKQL